MSEENKINDALSIPLNNIQNNNADQDINKNQNKNKEINENAFLSFKTGLENVSKRIIYENHELNKKYNVFINHQIESYQKIYNSWRCCKKWECLKCCECCLCCSYCFWGCCKKENASNEDIQRIKDNLKELENIEINKKEDKNNIISKIDIKKMTFFCLFYFFSFFHFFALSEVHGILLALLKEVVRSITCHIKGHYDFENNVIKDFHYYLTESNYHDSSQINFNYMTSLFSLFIIRLISNKYRIQIIYLISIVVISFFSILLISMDYISVEELQKEGEVENYGWLKIIFCFILIYIIIYSFAGFISLLPNKILEEYLRKNGLTEIKYKVLNYGLINLIIGGSVTFKNFVNYYWIYLIKKNIKKLLDYECESIHNIILSEISLFFFASLIYLSFIFIYDIGCRCTCKKRVEINEIGPIEDKGEEDNLNYNINEVLNDENDDEKSIKFQIENKIVKEKQKNFSIKYLAGFIFIKTNQIYSFIHIKGLWFYFLSILTNAKIVFIIFINFCSRIQKLKFKTDYKDSKISENWMFSIFLVSFGLYIIVYFFIYFGIFIKRKCQKNKNENIEDADKTNITKKNENIKNIDISNITIEMAILIFLILVFMFVFVVSLIFYINESYEEITVYLSIAVTGSVNYLLYDFYSCQEAEYISLSGVVSIAQLVFRFIELCGDPFEANWTYLFQMIFSFIGAIFTFIYLFKFVEEDINLCFCI